MASSDWDDVKRLVEPIVAEIDQPDAVLARIEVVLHGDGQEEVSSRFTYAGPTPSRNAALVRHAATLLQGHAQRMEERHSG
jgi:hypothetical protein